MCVTMSEHGWDGWEAAKSRVCCARPVLLPGLHVTLHRMLGVLTHPCGERECHEGTGPHLLGGGRPILYYATVRRDWTVCMGAVSKHGWVGWEAAKSRGVLRASAVRSAAPARSLPLAERKAPRKPPLVEPPRSCRLPHERLVGGWPSAKSSVSARPPLLETVETVEAPQPPGRMPLRQHANDAAFPSRSRGREGP